MVLAEITSFTDLIIGGHTHSFLAEPIIQKNKLGKPIIINQAWWGGLMIGKIDFVMERSRTENRKTFATNI
jgi:5'-nucleotidase